MIELVVDKYYDLTYFNTGSLVTGNIKVTGIDPVGNFIVNYYNSFSPLFPYEGYINVLTGEMFVDGIATGMYVVAANTELPKGFCLSCDCGGHKTYGSWSKEYHSTWCKVNT